MLAGILDSPQQKTEEVNTADELPVRDTTRSPSSKIPLTDTAFQFSEFVCIGLLFQLIPFVPVGKARSAPIVADSLHTSNAGQASLVNQEH